MAQSDIGTFNALSVADFRARFWQCHPNSNLASNIIPWTLDLQSSSTISTSDFDQCFGLIQTTSSEQYAASSLGWHPTRKKREMRLPDLKYILVKGDRSGEHNTCEDVEGFLSFMLTYEDGIDVIYCYELHLKDRCRGQRIGKCLMEHMEDVGRIAGVKKAMLTVFKANVAALGFYERLGYGMDDFSPRPKRLRGGIVKEADYIILSKSLVKDETVLVLMVRSPME